MTAAYAPPVAAHRVTVTVRRRRTHPCDKGIRKVRGARYQLRVFTGPHKGDSWNFGLYETHEAALIARNRLFGAGHWAGRPVWLPHMGPLEALAAAKRAGVVPAGVLPRWVVRLPGGGYAARIGPRRRRVDLPGPYPTPHAAYRAAAALTAAHYPTGVSA